MQGAAFLRPPRRAERNPPHDHRPDEGPARRLMPEDFDADREGADRRHRAAAGASAAAAHQLEQVRGDLRGIHREVQALREDLAKLRAETAEDARGGLQRGWLIQRLEERLADFQKSVGEKFADALKRLDKVEKDYVSQDRLKDEISPIWKWTGVAGAALITGAIGLVFAWLKGGGSN